MNRYVTFRRAYEKMDYRIVYHNNTGGMVPGPNDWDIRIVAHVPCGDLAVWTEGMPAFKEPDKQWLTDMKTAIDLSGVSAWYKRGSTVVGVDPLKCIVTYRNSTK